MARKKKPTTEQVAEAAAVVTAEGEPSAFAAAHAPLATVAAELPSAWVSPQDVWVEFDDRTILSPDQTAIDKDLAVSIFLHGQKQPAVVFKNDVDEKYEILSGRTRRRAILLINAGFEAVDPRTNETVVFKDENRKLWVVVDSAKGKEDAFVEALITNIKVNKLDDVQEAYAVKKLTEEFGWSLTDAAKLFGYNNTNRASKLLKLLEQPESIINDVQAGNLALQTAVDLAPVRAELRLTIIEKVRDAEGKVDGSKVREALRDVYSDGDEEVSEKTGTPKTKSEDDAEDKPASKKKVTEEAADPKPVKLDRNTAALKKFIAEVVADDELSAPVKAYHEKLLKWLEGRVGDKALYNAFENFKAK